MKLEKVDRPKLHVTLTLTEDEIAIINHNLLAYCENRPYSDEIAVKGKDIANQLYDLLEGQMIFEVTSRRKL